MRGYEAGRLMVTPQARAVWRRQWLAIDADIIRGGDCHCRRRQHSAIDRDPPIDDPTLGITPRAHAGAGQDLGDALGALAGGKIDTLAAHQRRDINAAVAGRVSQWGP